MCQSTTVGAQKPWTQERIIRQHVKYGPTLEIHKRGVKEIWTRVIASTFCKIADRDKYCRSKHMHPFLVARAELALIAPH